MSTILKALRRLEEDGPSSEAGRAGGLLPATHPGATNELRDRILAEESAAESVGNMQGDLERRKRIAFSILAAAAAAIILLGFGAYWIAPSVAPDPRDTELAEVPRPDSPASAVLPAPTRASVAPTSQDVMESATGSSTDAPSDVAAVAATASVAAAANTSATDSPTDSRPTPAPTSAPEEMALAAVVPTTAVVEAHTMRASSTQTSVAPPPARNTTRTPRVASGNTSRTSSTNTPMSRSGTTPRNGARPVADPTPAATSDRPVRSRASPTTTSSPSPSPASAPRRKPAPLLAAAEKTHKVSAPRSESLSRAKPAAPTPEAEAASVSRADHRVLPDLTVLRTAWHPDAERRSAKIRLGDNEKVITLREGDAVGEFVLKSITPSAVVFKVGDVEIQRRVGQLGSGG